MSSLYLLHPLLCLLITACVLTLTALRLSSPSPQLIGVHLSASLLYALIFTLFQAACSIALHHTTKLALSIARRSTAKGSIPVKRILRLLRVGLTLGCAVCGLLSLGPLLALPFLPPSYRRPVIIVTLTASQVPYWALGLTSTLFAHRIRAHLNAHLDHLTSAQRGVRTAAVASIMGHSAAIKVALLTSIPVCVLVAAYPPLMAFVQWVVFVQLAAGLLVLGARLRMITLPKEVGREARGGVQVVPMGTGLAQGSPMAAWKGAGEGVSAMALSARGALPPVRVSPGAGGGKGGMRVMTEMEGEGEVEGEDSVQMLPVVLPNETLPTMLLYAEGGEEGGVVDPAASPTSPRSMVDARLWEMEVRIRELERQATVSPRRVHTAEMTPDSLHTAADAD